MTLSRQEFRLLFDSMENIFDRNLAGLGGAGGGGRLSRDRGRLSRDELMLLPRSDCSPLGVGGGGGRLERTDEKPSGGGGGGIGGRSVCLTLTRLLEVLLCTEMLSSSGGSSLMVEVLHDCRWVMTLLFSTSPLVIVFSGTSWPDRMISIGRLLMNSFPIPSSLVRMARAFGTRIGASFFG